MVINFTIYGEPRTKKNGARIVRAGGFPRLLPSKAYTEYRADALKQLLPFSGEKVDRPVNICVRYFMKSKRRVDLVNLLEATCDILTDAEIIADDNSEIVASHDGSRVIKSDVSPRAEITITPLC